MKPRLQIKYPRTWTEATTILQNLNVELFKIGQIKDKHRRAKEWNFVVQQINVLKDSVDLKITESTIILEENKHHKKIASVISEGLILAFHHRFLKALKDFMFHKKVPILK